MVEEPITFKNRNGEELFGIVHIPEKSPLLQERIGINLLNPGIKYRVAPHRLNVKLARQLCENGYYVLRFDPSGIGDSEGELPQNFSAHDIWGKIQTGLFVKDTTTANDFFIDRYGINKLILIGNCGGAITALLTSAEDTRVNALCLIDVPIYLWGSNRSFADVAIQGGKKSDWLFSEYIKRLFRFKSWYRFMTFKTNYGALWKTLKTKFQKTSTHVNDKPIPTKNLEDLCKDKKLNIFFFKSFEAFVNKSNPILFVSAGNDPGVEIFQNYFQNGYLKENHLKNKNYELVDIFLVENANHIYTLYKWQELLLNKVSNWINLNV